MGIYGGKEIEPANQPNTPASTPSVATSSTPVTTSVFTPPSTPTALSFPVAANSNAAPTMSTTQKPKSTSSSKPAPGVANGAVAGIAIGCFIGGALIAAIACFLLFRRRNRNRRHAYSASSNNYLPSASRGRGPENGVVVAASNIAGVKQNILNELPQPMEDKAIIDDVSRIRDDISNHIREFYGFNPTQSIGMEDKRLDEFAACTGISSSGLRGLLANPDTWEDSMRLLVAWIILRKCDGRSIHESLLPGNLGLVKIDEPMLFSKWKVLTATMLKKDQNLQSPAQAKLFKELNAVIIPFVQGNSKEAQRHNHLNLIISRAAALAMLLFSQPGSFRFEFSNQPKGVVVFPALEQVVGDQAQKLSPPRLLLEKEVLY
ncbi:hypothetical protein BS50DRAFT_676180 [Corynespora cassiicola Philippines]|uniref:Uncharacterized protein n=1 Tax=Corynespora cassiicola Philippines TaxID=1448308 RepID=A0A2T2NSC2_CORCC|nr:hypothetical protein BS50DRAFT_676180 [Corynespora cassiicola Philippines]